MHLLHLPTEVIQYMLDYLIYPNTPDHWKELLSDDSHYNHLISISLENTKRIILKLQSISSFFRNDQNPIGRQFNEFWLLVMKREFYNEKEFINKHSEKILPNSKRYYGLLSEMVKIVHDDITRTIQKPQSFEIQFTFDCKVCIIGENGGGKSNIARRCANDDYCEVYDMATVEEIFRKTITIQNQTIRLEFEDVYNEEFSALKDLWVRNSNVNLIVFPSIHYSDKSLEESFNNLCLEMYRVLRIKDIYECPCIIAFTKSDLAESEDTSSFNLKMKENLIRRLIRQMHMLNCGIVHTSAKDNIGTDETLKEIGNRFLTLVSNQRTPVNNEQFQNWNVENILGKIIKNEKEIYKIIKKGSISDNERKGKCFLM